MFTNVRSLENRKDETKLLSLKEHFNFVGISETWLESSLNWAASIEGYTLFWRDRIVRKGAERMYVCTVCEEQSKSEIEG